MYVNTIEEINSILEDAISNNRKIGNIEDAINDDPDSLNYNCWGFVARLFGWIPKSQWIYNEEMDGYLRDHTVEINDPKPGDIAVWRDYGTLIHTAIVLDTTDDLIIIHKPAACHLEYGNYSKDNLITYKGKITYRRVK